MRPGFECFRTCCGGNVTLMPDMIILSIVIKWKAEFIRCPPRRSSSIRIFCDNCLSEIYLLSPRLLKYSNITWTSQTEESFGNGGLKLNDLLKNFITDGCWGMLWYFILCTCGTALLAKNTEIRTLWNTPLLKSSVKTSRNYSAVRLSWSMFFSAQYSFQSVR